jgi:hypothetical protein
VLFTLQLLMTAACMSAEPRSLCRVLTRHCMLCGSLDTNICRAAEVGARLHVEVAVEAGPVAHVELGGGVDRRPVRDGGWCDAAVPVTRRLACAVAIQVT